MNTLKAEANVLDRIMYMLDEYSVQYLVEQDGRFADYIDSLYAQVYTKSKQLRGQVSQTAQ